MNSQEIQPEENVVFVPSEEIRSIEQVLDKLEQAQQEFLKAAKEIEEREKNY